MKANNNIKASRGNVKDKRKAILEASLNLITCNGFHGTSMKMIAESAQIAAGTIYVYFDSKEEMIKALYHEIGLEINEIIDSCNKPELSFADNFMSIWIAILDFYKMDPRKPEFITQFTYSPYIIDDDNGGGNILLDPIKTIFEEAKKQELVKNLPIASLIALSHSPITALVRMTKYQHIDLTNMEIKRYAQACWDAISIRKFDLVNPEPSLNN